MKKGIIVPVLLVSLGLCACTASDPPTYQLAVENGTKEWQLKSVAIAESELESEVPESQAKSTVQPMLDDESPAVSLSTNIFSVMEEGTEDASGMELFLKPDREYTIKVQVVATVEEEYSASNLNLRVGFPLTIRKGGSDEMSFSVSIDDGRKASDRQAIATAMYDLNMEYVSGSCSITANGRYVLLQDDLAAEYTQDALGEDVGVSLEGWVPISSKMTTARTQEFVITYKVRTAMSDTQASEAKLHRENPIQLKIIGAVGQETGGEPSSMSSEALKECLQAGYMMPRQLDEAYDGKELYIVARLSLPGWATEYTREQGITVSWSSPMRGVASLDWDVVARLMNCTEMYGQTSDSLSMKVLAGGKTWSGVVTSVTLWRVEDEESMDIYQLGQRSLTVLDFDIGTTEDGAVCEISGLTLAGNYKAIQELDDGDNEIYIVAWLPRRDN